MSKLLCLEEHVQLVGMSATLSVGTLTFAYSSFTERHQNLKLLAKWLGDAKYYVSKYRPVPVEEHLVFENKVYPASAAKLFCKTATQLSGHVTCSSEQSSIEATRTISPSGDKEIKTTLVNAVVSLANETARAGYGALVFCSSRAGAERDAELISRVLPRPTEVGRDIMDKRMDLLSDLRSTVAGLDETLAKIVLSGVAFHRKCY